MKGIQLFRHRLIFDLIGLYSIRVVIIISPISCDYRVIKYVQYTTSKSISSEISKQEVKLTNICSFIKTALLLMKSGIKFIFGPAYTPMPLQTGFTSKRAKICFTWKIINFGSTCYTARARIIDPRYLVLTLSR